MDKRVEAIPKVIHYCWFGGKEKPPIVEKCIKSWNRHLPHYEVKEWNEQNFDVSCNSYVEEAYAAEMYAFVSDFVRVHALYHEGGIYLDTDVEVLKPFDELLKHQSFWGFEQGDYIATSTIGAVKGHPLIEEFLESYNKKKFIKEDGSFEQLTNVKIVTELLEKKGLKRNGLFQEIKQLGAFYPQPTFSPYDYINCRNLMNDSSFTIHHFHKGWLPTRDKVKGHLKRATAAIIGGDNIFRIRKFMSRGELK
ncbi:glycosyltransferase family 32 protein [Alkalihalobacillus pseudalcaliphilus]|uniref:glycosyltransferase family 32 protein n=1 Tax=Alkalihalobacillus pseudalcaliphilus TaxID=79884 RepID=UPI00064DCC6D|nr:glycosyltransferase [Alkalihalobacillus pseudalcaliphilus]KMK75036.1 glycosyl transferase [Alkalihalobacillus pseudalcaliphilus]